MKSRTVKNFRSALRGLPREVQQQANTAYMLFRENPRHPSLHFKLLRPKKRIYSVRIGSDYRALGVLDEDEIVWFWIGSHAEYDKLVDQL
jgi:mRNA-degrading endonuclease RelE of RelBE toxin-antitoxin system